MFALLGCSDPSAGESESGSMSGTDTSTSGTDTDTGTDTGTSDTGTDTNVDPATRGLPEGESSWSGEMEVNGLLFAAEATFINTNGDLEATVTFMDHPDQPLGFGMAAYSLSGTHEPTSGRVALAPDDWTIEPPLAIELLGFNGSYDPDTHMLTGMIADYASGTDNSFAGGPATLELLDGPGEPTVVGDEGAALPAGAHAFSGTSQCGATVRDVVGDIDYDGEGGFTGSLTLGDPDIGTPLGMFEFTGVHNPSTGGITLVPGLWINPNHNVASFFVDGTYDPSTGKFEGDQRVNDNGCVMEGWHVVIE